MKTYSTSEIAAILGISDVQVRRLCISGKLKGKKVGRDWRITPTALRKYQDNPVKTGRPKTAKP